MKVYTKTGDKGQTSLLSGERVPKHHLRIEAYGTVDELNSFIGLLREYNIGDNNKAILFKVQNLLFDLGAGLSIEKNKDKFASIKKVSDNDIKLLESEIDKMNEDLPALKSFILPGGSKAVATSHICRTICRRAERLCTNLAENTEVEELSIMYLNRLSDYLFVLARKIAFDNNVELPEWTVDGNE